MNYLCIIVIIIILLVFISAHIFNWLANNDNCAFESYIRLSVVIGYLFPIFMINLVVVV